MPGERPFLTADWHHVLGVTYAVDGTLLAPPQQLGEATHLGAPIADPNASSASG